MLKFIIIVFFFSLLSLDIYSQQNFNKSPDGFKTFLLYDSIEKFAGLLNCANSSENEVSISLEGKLNCNTFRYLPAQKDSVEVGNVKFNNTFLSIDSFKKINFISYTKTYLRNEVLEFNNSSNSDYNMLEIYLTQLLEVKGKKDKYKYGKYSCFSRGLVWIKKNRKYNLREFNLESKHRKVTNIINLDLSIVN